MNEQATDLVGHTSFSWAAATIAGQMEDGDLLHCCYRSHESLVAVGLNSESGFAVLNRRRTVIPLSDSDLGRILAAASQTEGERSEAVEQMLDGLASQSGAPVSSLASSDVADRRKTGS